MAGLCLSRLWQRAGEAGAQTNCLFSGAATGNALIGQASLPVREELAQGGYLTSLAGYGFTYNTLDNNKHPTNGILVSFGQDFAGLGGNAAYIRTTADFRSYYEIVSDLIGILHLQGGDMFGLTGCPTSGTCVSNGGYVRMLDDFKMGPNLVRGFRAGRLRSARYHAVHGRRSARRHHVLGGQY